VLVVPLALMALNLLVAIVTNSRINRRGGLLVFHMGLLGLVILAAIGRLTYFEAVVELRADQAFSDGDVLDDRQGPWHNGDLDRVEFVQGAYTVDYAPGLVRGLTHSYLMVRNDDGQWVRRVVGDDRPLVVEGYRFYTSFNKGFAPVVTWTPDEGDAVTGAIHMPSYPLFEFKQQKDWVPPGGEPVRLWLNLETGLTHDAAWMLDTQNAAGQLAVTTADEQRFELAPGSEIQLPGGTLRYDYLSSWMGYRIFYDPTIQWMFFVSIFSVAGLFVHFWRKIGLRLTVNVPDNLDGVRGGNALQDPVSMRRA
jgi:cytochrome c biogenesis protein